MVFENLPDDLSEYRLSVSNLNFNLEHSELREYFELAGSVSYVRIEKNRGKSLGKGIVVYPLKESAIWALTRLRNTILRGRKLHIEWDAKFADSYLRCDKYDRGGFSSDVPPQDKNKTEKFDSHMPNHLGLTCAHLTSGNCQIAQSIVETNPCCCLGIMHHWLMPACCLLRVALSAIFPDPPPDPTFPRPVPNTENVDPLIAEVLNRIDDLAGMLDFKLFIITTLLEGHTVSNLEEQRPCTELPLNSVPLTLRNILCDLHMFLGTCKVVRRPGEEGESEDDASKLGELENKLVTLDKLMNLLTNDVYSKWRNEPTYRYPFS
jgi:hypothetical protein